MFKNSQQPDKIFFFLLSSLPVAVQLSVKKKGKEKSEKVKKEKRESSMNLIEKVASAALLGSRTPVAYSMQQFLVHLSLFNVFLMKAD